MRSGNKQLPTLEFQVFDRSPRVTVSLQACHILHIRSVPQIIDVRFRGGSRIHYSCYTESVIGPRAEASPGKRVGRRNGT